MSNTLLLINPHKRGTTGRAAKMANAKKPRTAAQKRATAALVALNKKRRAGVVYQKNPTQKSLFAESKAPAKKARTYVMKDAKGSRKTTVTYKRNPLPPRAKGLFQENIKPSALGAAAALGFDLVWGRMTFIPPSLRAGVMQYPVKLIGAIALGMAAEKFLPKEYQKHATTLVRGPLTVIMHEAGKKFIQDKYPSLGLMAYEEDQLAEILHESQMNGYAYEENYQLQPNTMGETLQLQGLGGLGASPLYVPQYDDVAY